LLAVSDDYDDDKRNDDSDDVQLNWPATADDCLERLDG